MCAFRKATKGRFPRNLPEMQERNGVDGYAVQVAKEKQTQKKVELMKMREGWTTPTLAFIENQWRIYSDSAVAFVPLEKALPELVATCPGQLKNLRNLI